MLEIRPLSRYATARYPRYGQYTEPPKLAGTIIRDAATLLALAALLESCSSSRTGGVPPPPPVITEAHARPIIDQIFANSNVGLVPDRPVDIHLTPADSMQLNLDGYNDSLQVGYEYITGTDRQSFTPVVRQQLDSLKYIGSPHLLILDPELESIYDEARLEHITQNFLDSLRAHGII